MFEIQKLSVIIVYIFLLNNCHLGLRFSHVGSFNMGRKISTTVSILRSKRGKNEEMIIYKVFVRFPQPTSSRPKSKKLERKSQPKVN